MEQQKKIAGQFFENFAKVLESNNPDLEEETQSANIPNKDTHSKSIKISPFVWISGLVIGVFALILLYNSIN